MDQHDHPFLRGLGEEARERLMACANARQFKAGEFLLRTGEPARHFHLICAGRVTVEVVAPAGPPIIVETLREGDALGWSWAVPPYQYAFDARATAQVHALSLDAGCLRAEMEADATLGYAILQRLLPVVAHRLTSARIQMLDLYAPEPRRPAV